MADINNNDIWIDVETLAKLKNITRRAVRLALNQNKYEYKVENIYYSQGDNMVFQFASNEIRNNELMARLEKISDEIEILKSGMVAITITNDMKN